MKVGQFPRHCLLLPDTRKKSSLWLTRSAIILWICATSRASEKLSQLPSPALRWRGRCSARPPSLQFSGRRSTEVPQSGFAEGLFAQAIAARRREQSDRCRPEPARPSHLRAAASPGLLRASAPACCAHDRPKCAESAPPKAQRSDCDRATAPVSDRSTADTLRGPTPCPAACDPGVHDSGKIARGGAVRYRPAASGRLEPVHCRPATG